MKIDVENVSYTYAGRYQQVAAVKEVTASFTAGALYAIMGTSGSGKTTLLSLLAGIKQPTSGTIRLDGKPLSAMNANALRRDIVSVIYQEFNLFPLLTAAENVSYPLLLQEKDKQTAARLAREKLEAVGLQAEQCKRLPNQLSGGEQQRVAIARALAAGSEIILADEPTGNLDEENSRNIVAILKRLAHEENRCVIVVTHDPTVAEQADVVLKMQDGKINAQEAL